MPSSRRTIRLGLDVLEDRINPGLIVTVPGMDNEGLVALGGTGLNNGGSFRTVNFGNPNPNNDDTTVKQNFWSQDIRFGQEGYIDTVVQVNNSNGISEFRYEANIENRTGFNWAQLTFQVGFGRDGLFSPMVTVPVANGKSLSLDWPELSMTDAPGDQHLGFSYVPQMGINYIAFSHQHSRISMVGNQPQASVTTFFFNVDVADSNAPGMPRMMRGPGLPPGYDLTIRWTAGDAVALANNAPVGANNVVTALEDTSFIFSPWDFGFSDPNDSPTHNFHAVQIASLPAAGMLTNDGVPVSAGAFISVADLIAGKLQFTAPPNAFGTAFSTFTFRVQDDGGTSGGGIDLDQIVRTMTIDVLSVNDAPSGADGTVVTTQSSDYVFSVGNFGFADPVDAHNFLALKVSSLPTSGTLYWHNGTSWVAVTQNQFITAADIAAGKLKYTPPSSTTGIFTFGFRVQDDGGTENGGIDLDLTDRTMTVNVA